MKINEIIISELTPPTGQNAGKQAEKRRSEVEYRTLKRFDQAFADEFKRQFIKHGETSVDAAYQAAQAETLKKQKQQLDLDPNKSAEEKKKEMADYISAMPELSTYSQAQKDIRTARKDKKGTGTVGGQMGNQNAYRGGQDTSPGIIRTAIDGVKDVWNKANVGQGFKKGRALGKTASGWYNQK